MNCQYCKKDFFGKSSYSNHVRRCPNNPNRVMEKLTSDGLKRIIEKNKNVVWSDERRKKHSESMKKAVEKHPDSYTSSNRGRTKQIFYDGIKFQGKWELDFYKYCKNNSVKIVKCNEWFEYEWNGLRKYFPDFYLSELDLYIEIKGYETDRDRAKWNAFPKKLKVIKKEEIKLIRENKVLDL